MLDTPSIFISALIFFFFNDTATTEIYTLSLHDALPIWRVRLRTHRRVPRWPGDSHAAPATAAGHAHGRRTGRRQLGPRPPRTHPDSRGSLLVGQSGAGDTGPGLHGGSPHGGRPRALLLRSGLPRLLCLRDGAPAMGRAADLPRTCGW